MRIHPFHAIRPTAELAERVASPPYDVIDTPTARRIADGNPDSFLHVVRPEIDLPEGTSLYDDSVYEQARKNFDDFLRRGVLQRDSDPGLFIYRLTLGTHQQSGIVATCHIDDYEKDLIKKHEKTLKSKEDDRTRHVSTLNANTGPVFLTYSDKTSVDVIVKDAQAQSTLYDFVAPSGVRHETWKVPEPSSLVEAFCQIPAAYVADGHHRSASAVRVGRERCGSNPTHSGKEAYNWFLTVLFPASQLHVLAYNRIVSDLGGLSSDGLLREINERFEVVPDANPIPNMPRHVSMYLAGEWYDLSWPENSVLGPVASLDVSVLQDRLLGPILGVHDPRTDDRMGFVGGILGWEELRERVDSGAFAVAFSMHPTSVKQLMDIADSGNIMPPKSTWFEPKLCSGLFVHSLV